MLEKITPDKSLTGVDIAVSLVDGPAQFRRSSSIQIDDNPVDEALKAMISGLEGFGGPDGSRYSIDWNGEIRRSNYAIDVEGFYFPYPARQPLPVRYVVPNGQTDFCYICHRLDAPLPAADIAEIAIPPVTLPATPTNEAELTLVKLTDGRDAETGAVWSPDGQSIVYISGNVGTYQLFIMDPNGQNKRQLTSGTSRIYAQPMFSPDSARLTYWGHDERDRRVVHLQQQSSGGPTRRWSQARCEGSTAHRSALMVPSSRTGSRPRQAAGTFTSRGRTDRRTSGSRAPSDPRPPPSGTQRPRPR
ncbi:MAG: hypothetical protein HC923_05905 [Myxococcales bacterium]|nr:hypothetical protein [Myxococcales bacterium]